MIRYICNTIKILFDHDLLDPCKFPNDFHRTRYLFK